jgi:integrase
MTAGDGAHRIQIAEAARRLGVSPRTVRRMCLSGELPAAPSAGALDCQSVRCEGILGAPHPCNALAMPHPASNLYQRNGIWWARVRIAGREVRRSLRTPHRAEAVKRLKPLLAEAETVRADPVRATGERTWVEAVERYMQVGFPALKESTRRRYESSLRMMHPAFGHLRLSDITGDRISAYASQRMADGATAATVRRGLAVASRVFRLARRNRWTAHNPVPDEKAELRERRAPIRPTPLRTIAAVLRAAAPGLADLIRFAAKTGCRQEEAAGLQRQHVDLAGRTVAFTRTKTNRPRVVALTASTVRLLARALAEPGPPEQPVFRRADGQRWSSVSSLWRNAVARAGVPHCRFHDLRHTYAIRWLQAGGSIYALARRLGHSSVRTTEIYSAWLARAPD